MPLSLIPATRLISASLFDSTIPFYLGRDVIEIGAGCGLVGITAAALGARSVVLTDLKSQQSHLLRNIELNRASWDSSCTLVSAGVLQFGDTSVTDNIPQTASDSGCCPKVFDVVLGADVGYDLSLHEPIARTVTSLLSSRSPCDSFGRPISSMSSQSSIVETNQPFTRIALLAEEVRWRDIHCWYLESLSRNSTEFNANLNREETCCEITVRTPGSESMGIEKEEDEEDVSNITSHHTVTNTDRYTEGVTDTPPAMAVGTYSHTHSLLFEGGGKNSLDSSQGDADEGIARKSRNSIHLLSLSCISESQTCEQNT